MSYQPLAASTFCISSLYSLLTPKLYSIYNVQLTGDPEKDRLILQL